MTLRRSSRVFPASRPDRGPGEAEDVPMTEANAELMQPARKINKKTGWLEEKWASCHASSGAEQAERERESAKRGKDSWTSQWQRGGPALACGSCSPRPH